MTWLLTFYQSHKDVINLVIVAALALIGGNFASFKDYVTTLIGKLTGKTTPSVLPFPTGTSVNSPDISESLLGASDEQLNFYYVMQLRRWAEANNRNDAVLTCDRLLIALFNSVNQAKTDVPPSIPTT